MEQKPSPIVIKLLIKFVCREALSDKDYRVLDDWYRESPENRILTKQLSDAKWVWNNLLMPERAPKKEMWKAINRHLDNLEAEDKGIKKVSFFKRLFFRLKG